MPLRRCISAEDGTVLSVRVAQLLTVGLCLLLIAKYMQFMHATVHGLDRLMMRRFFDVDGLTTEIQARVERNGGDLQTRRSSGEFVSRAVYLWLCQRLRRVAGLDSGTD